MDDIEKLKSLANENRKRIINKICFMPSIVQILIIQTNN